MNREKELEQTALLSRRISEATAYLFAGQSVASQIDLACSTYDQQCHDILVGRGLPMLTIAIIGAKGQGKTWTARQLVLDSKIRESLPSGVLSRDATNQLYWIGSMAPEPIEIAHEKFIYCPAASMADLGVPYMLLDTPGSTDANLQANDLAKAALSLSPIQILVVRRDQLRSATTSPIAQRSEGVICIPVITSVPRREFNPASVPSRLAELDPTTSSPALRSDIERWMRMVQESAPHSQVLEPILIGDFEASGDELGASDLLRKQIQARLQGHPLDALAQTTINRLNAASSRLKHQVNRLLQTETPQLSRAVMRLQDEAKQLPKRAIESVLGSSIVLETAIRARMRTQMVADTSPLCFPFRTTLSILSFTQGAWDRLVLAMTGSIPSIFGTFVAWARNVQQTRKIEWEMQQGLRERLSGQIQDQLSPIQHQFHRALAQLRGDEPASQTPSLPNAVRLSGVDELQSRSRMLFEQLLLQHRPARWMLWVVSLIGMIIFWSLLAGPIVSIYRQYVMASYNALSTNKSFVGLFDLPSLSMMVTSVVLSFIPMLLYAMISMTALLRRSKIERLARGLQAEHHVLVDELEQNGILRLEYEDPLLEQAQYLLSLDRKGHE